MAVTPHGVLHRDSHEIAPTIGGVHKLMILLRNVLNEKLQKIFGEEMGGGQGDPDLLIKYPPNVDQTPPNCHFEIPQTWARLIPQTKRQQVRGSFSIACAY